jgi:hypothetical protein
VKYKEKTCRRGSLLEGIIKYRGKHPHPHSMVTDKLLGESEGTPGLLRHPDDFLRRGPLQ